MTEQTSDGARLLDRLRYHERGYTEVEAAIASALLGDPARAIAEPIGLFANRAGVSAGSVVRFARLMGFPGYRAFKYALAAQPREEEAAAEAQSSRPAALLESQARAIQFAAQSLNQAIFQLAAEVLCTARAIDVVGVGAASATARAAEFQFTTSGLHCRRIEDPGEAAAAAAFLGPQGVLLAISHSGRTRATVDAAERARASGACVIVVCSAPRSPLAARATHLLAIEASRTRYGEDELPFRAAHLAMVQALATTAAEALDPGDRGARRATWASARFEMRYGVDSSRDVRSSTDPETLTN